MKCFMIIPGKTALHDTIIKDLETWLTPEKVPNVDECDFILVFCVVVSRAGTDIDAALNEIKDIPESKPVVFMVGHYTFNPEKVLIDSSQFVSRMNTLTVDCLFNEDNLLNFTANRGIPKKIQDWLQKINQDKEKTIDKDLTVHLELILMLLGMSTSEVTAVANLILGRKENLEDTPPNSQRKITMETGEVEKAKVILFNTPDWFGSELSPEEIQQQIQSCLYLFSQKPYALLLLIPEKQFNDQEKVRMRKMEMVFKEKFTERLMIVFTLTGEQHKISNPDLESLMKKCKVCQFKLDFRAEESKILIMNEVEKMLAGRLQCKSLTVPQLKAAEMKSEQKLIENERDFIKKYSTNTECTCWISPKPSEGYEMLPEKLPGS